MVYSLDYSKDWHNEQFTVFDFSFFSSRVKTFDIDEEEN